MKMMIASLAMASIGMALAGTTGVLAADTQQILAGTNLNISEELPSFKNIDLDAGIMETQIIEGDKFYIEASANELSGNFIYKVQNDTLFIKHEAEKDDHKWFTSFKEIDDNKIDLKIYIPRDTNPNEVDIESGASNMVINDVNIENLEVEMGMGDLTIEDMVIKNLEVECGMGDFIGKNITSYNTNVEGGMGKIELEGDFAGHVEIEAGMGDVSLTTTREYNDYNFRIEKGFGDVDINNRDYVFFGGNINENRNGKYVIDVEMGMGNIEINTN
ncbi:hypothetical protein AN639_11185 [Candidatus Epulonipiscium fishelsonii]|uniref:Uncharacterized protein n=1 Tax=Candidatus Epulonipiscium fishelsonii TaxID=77094 RepID=A0ACC8X998_9FIRM|nr:hypothetical protein AN396_10365 [Epulopiscium sp. SCG-B11WGA-EpuloA1]ONI43153.1 hypothetical protein AN639_11185 [Epulopiscium sp. SCG-B05WGA-EpuloA1]